MLSTEQAKTPTIAPGSFYWVARLLLSGHLDAAAAAATGQL